MTGVFNVGVWTALVAGGAWVWSKVQETNEQNAKIAPAKASDAVRDEVRAWWTASEKGEVPGGNVCAARRR